MMKNIRWHQVIIAFLLGCVLTAAFFHCRWRWWRFDGKDRYERMLDSFSRELDLTAEQRADVARIFESKRRKIEAIRAETGPRFDEIRRATSEDIRRILTPGQIEKLDKMEKRHEEMRSRWRDRGKGPPVPPR